VRVTLVIATLGGGGAERVAANMANCWAAKGWAIVIITTCFGDQPSSYDLDPRVTRIDVESRRLNRLPIDPRELTPLAGLLADCSQAERAALVPQTAHLMMLRETILATRPQAVISYIDVTNLFVLAATRGSGLPVIVSEQCDPSHNFIGDGWELLRRRLYPQARYVAVLTEESLGYFSGVPGIRGRIIPNPLTPAVFSESEDRPHRKAGKTLMAMGRLAQEKGFDRLLHAFALVARRNTDWTLEIVGEGSLRPYLESCIQKFDLEGRVRLPGFTRQPFDAMRRADLFVLSSLCEGFPNVLLEAMACGVAVVSFDCPSGPRHIIRNGIDGTLVPAGDTQALAVALDRLMGDPVERKRLAAKAPEVAERFSADKIMSMWEALVVECASHQ
jgi:GalNAc-alpha-(1->4)-GalNAc-alpha-(1->3)-diNAcBac-PP-undecaprenol alpha-1,4-N-acetyl-D-galactosaminyltransferase